MSGKKINNASQLIDRFGRAHSYLRLSITENCNFRCLYCMPEQKDCHTNNNLLTPYEIEIIAKEFVKLGINKIRLTGGEPLVRKDFKDIASRLGKLEIEKAITTNGYLLDKHIEDLLSNNFRHVNISLDSLQPERFKEITQRNKFQKVVENLLLAISEGLDVKINAVIMKGFNDDELIDFARLTLSFPVSVRFIEFMPFKKNNWSFGRLVRQEEMLEILRREYNLQPYDDSGNYPASYYKIPGSEGKIGIIGTVSKPFCDTCNRIRVTSDGKIKSCLFGTSELDLLYHLRNKEDLSGIIHSALSQKPFMHGDKNLIRNYEKPADETRGMYSIGG